MLSSVNQGQSLCDLSDLKDICNKVQTVLLHILMDTVNYKYSSWVYTLRLFDNCGVKRKKVTLLVAPLPKSKVYFY